MANQTRNELKLAHLRCKNITEDNKLKIFEDLDISCIITSKREFAGYNSLHIAVMHTDLDLMQKLLHLGANLLQQGIEDGKTPLRKAIDSRLPYWKRTRHPKVSLLVDALLSAQIKNNNRLNAKCKSGISHLHIACMFNHTEAILFFVSCNESVDQVINADSDIFPGFTPLHCAISYFASEAAATLLTFGADIYLENAEGENSVCYLIKRLLQAHDYFKLTNASDHCPDDKEIERLDSIVKEIVLKNRSDDMKLVEKTGLSAFHLACMLEDDSIMQSCITFEFKEIDKPVSCLSKVWSGWTPLHFAACCNIKNFQILLQNRANITIKNREGETALDLYFQRYSAYELFSCLPFDTFLTDKSTQLLNLMLAISNSNTFQQFLMTMKDINSSVPLDCPYWPGYNLLHISISMHLKVMLYGRSSKETHWYMERIKIILCNGCMVHAKNADGLTPIHLAFKLRKWDVLEELLVCADQNIVGADNLSILHIACAMGELDVVERLLKNGAYVNSVTSSTLAWNEEQKTLHYIPHPMKFDIYKKVSITKNSTPLHIAVMFKMEKVVKLLIKNHAHIHAQDELGVTPLHLALAATQDIALVLLNHTTNLRDVRTKDGLSYLHVAAFANDEKAMKEILQDEADVTGFIKNSVPDIFADFIGQTPLHLTIKSKPVARILIEKGANIFTDNPYYNNATPLDLATKVVKFYKVEVVDLIVLYYKLYRRFRPKEIWVNPITSSGMTALHIALATRDSFWVRNLLRRGVNFNAQMADGRTPMHIYIAVAKCSHRFLTSTEELLEHGVDVTIADNNCDTPLHLIANACFIDKIYRAPLLPYANLMLSNQKSYALNPMDADGFSHFHFACVTNNLAVISKFLDNGIDINHTKSPFAPESGGFTSLHFAIENKNGDVVRLLLERGADVSIQDKHGNTPLHLAVINDSINMQLSDALIKNGADINARNLKNETPFVYLLYHSKLSYEKFYFFINRGVAINFMEYIYEGQGTIGYTLENTEENDVESVFGAFVEFCNIKDAINRGFMAIHNLVSVRKSKNLTRQQYFKIIQKFVEEGSDIDEQDENGKSALELAITFKNYRAIGALLSLGADNEQSYSLTVQLCTSDFSEQDEISVSFIKKYLWKIAFLKFDLTASDPKVIEEWEFDHYFVQRCQAELQKIKRTRIFQTMTANDFLSERAAVIDYPDMSIKKREAVDNFFRQGDELRKQFPEFSGLLTMQYRKALARLRLILPAKDIFVSVGIHLPDLCLEAIRKYFKNVELKFWINESSKEHHFHKRQKIQ